MSTMSVRHLIKLLETLPEDAEVWVCSSSGRHETAGAPLMDEYVEDGKTIKRVTLEADW